jgi:hypothetical protein
MQSGACKTVLFTAPVPFHRNRKMMHQKMVIALAGSVTAKWTGPEQARLIAPYDYAKQRATVTMTGIGGDRHSDTSSHIGAPSQSQISRHNDTAQLNLPLSSSARFIEAARKRKHHRQLLPVRRYPALK